MDKPINEADYIPVNVPTPFTAFSPVVFDVPGRQTALQLKVTVPARGDEVPTILHSHGHGSSTYL